MDFKSVLTSVINAKIGGAIILFFALGLGSVQAQNRIDINALDKQSLYAEIIDDSPAVKIFKDADRYRHFDYNKQLAILQAENKGDTLLLNFFADKQYKAVIQRVMLINDGSTAITSQIVGSDFAYCYIVVSDTSIAISANLPQEDEYFFASVKNGQTYIGQMKKTVLDDDRLEGSESLTPSEQIEIEEEESLDTNGSTGFLNDPVLGDPISPYTIDLLFIYTKSAVNWANSSIHGNINTVISLAVAEANNAMANSGTGVTFNVVHKYMTNYAGGNSNDLSRLSDIDGYMDEALDLRNVFYADMMIFLDSMSWTGGQGWLLNNMNGFTNDTRAANVCRVQQTASGLTLVHEIGHNMGTHHHAGQTLPDIQTGQPGPNTGLPSPFNLCSSGWRGTISGTRFCTLMTYEDGKYFSDSLKHTRIPYFSSPDTTYNGGSIGNLTTMDNSRVIRETKTVTAGYRTPPITPTLTVSPGVISFSGAPSATKKVAISAFNTVGNISYVLGGNNPNAFTITPSSTWIANEGGILDITFTGSTSQNYDAYITVSVGGGAASKTISLKHIVCSASVALVNESFNEPVFPPDCWTSSALTAAKWSAIQGTGFQPNAQPYSGVGMLEFHCFNSAAANSKGLLISPKIATSNQNSTLSFWMYRDDYNYASYDHKVNVYVNATPSTNGATLLATIHGYRQNTPAVSTSTWHLNTVNLPTSSLTEAYVIFEGVKGSSGHINMYLDSIRIVGFKPTTYKVTATAGNNGTISPQGDTTVIEGNNLTFNFTPNTGYHIDSVFIDSVYNAAAVTNGYHTFSNMMANHRIHVTFAINTYKVTATAGNNGTISPSGDTTVNHGGSLTFYFTPNTGYHIDSVFVYNLYDATAVANGYFTFTNIMANQTIRVTFAINTYKITATADSNGTISPSGNTTVNYGDNLTVHFTAKTGYHLDSVFVDNVYDSAAVANRYYTFTNVTANHAIYATFAVNDNTNIHTITATAGNNGTISPLGDTAVNEGNNLTFNFIPHTGYHIDSVFVNNVYNAAAVADGYYTFVNVAANQTIHVTFAINTYEITATASGSGGIEPNGVITVNYGDSITFHYAAILGGGIRALFVDNVQMPYMSGYGSYIFENIVANHTIHADFRDVGVEVYDFKNAITLYPNPATHQVELKIENNNLNVKNITLYDMYGKSLQEIPIVSPNTLIDLKAYSSSIYFVRVDTEHGFLTKKLVKD